MSEPLLEKQSVLTVEQRQHLDTRLGSLAVKRLKAKTSPPGEPVTDFYDNSVIFDRVEIDPVDQDYGVSKARSLPEDAIAGPHNEVADLIEAQIERQASSENQQTTIDWEKAAFNLLSQAFAQGEVQLDETDKDQFIVAAIASSQFADSNRPRHNLLRVVYDNNWQERVRQACYSSPVLLITREDQANAGPQIYYHRISSYDGAFSLKQEDFARYSQYMEGDRPTTVGNAKQLQRKLMDAHAEGKVDTELQHQAEYASIQGEKVDDGLQDIYKAERFALQQLFIRKQMHTLFPDNDFSNSPFSRQLESFRNKSTILDEEDIVLEAGVSADDAIGNEAREAAEVFLEPLNKLLTDAGSAISRLSQPVIEEFRIPISKAEPLTRSQQVAKRFRDVVGHTGRFNDLVKYIDFEHFEERSRTEIVTDFNRDTDIWTISEEGAAAPDVCLSVLSRVVHAAYKEKIKNGQAPSPERLKELAHSMRSELLGLATSNIADFSERVNGPIFNSITSDELAASIDADSTMHFEQDQNGEYQLFLDQPIKASKGDLDMYAAETLGCPALRVTSNDRRSITQEQRASHGSANYIDHLLAAMINEAYARGVFNIDNYDFEKELIKVITRRPPVVDDW